MYAMPTSTFAFRYASRDQYRRCNVYEFPFCEVLCVVMRQMARRLVINPANVLRLVNMKLRRTILREDRIGVGPKNSHCRKDGYLVAYTLHWPNCFKYRSYLSNL